MRDVALPGIIRRWHLCDQIPLREIIKQLAIARHTVRRYLRSEIIESTYAEHLSIRAVHPHAVQLSGWLKTEAPQSCKQRRSLKQLYEALINLGFKGSYDRVAAFARQWREGQTEWVNSARKRTLSRFDNTLEFRPEPSDLSLLVIGCFALSWRITIAHHPLINTISGNTTCGHQQIHPIRKPSTSPDLAL